MLKDWVKNVDFFPVEKIKWKISDWNSKNRLKVKSDILVWIKTVWLLKSSFCWLDNFQKRTTANLKIDFNFSVCTTSNPIILCIYTLDGNYIQLKRKRNIFHSLTIKTKRILGLQLALTDASKNNYGVRITERYS